MTNAEMTRRILTIKPATILEICRLIRAGWGANSIRIETDATLAQINAVFQHVEQQRARDERDNPFRRV